MTNIALLINWLHFVSPRQGNSSRGIHTLYTRHTLRPKERHEKQHQDFIETDDKAISEVLNGVVLVMDFYNI